MLDRSHPPLATTPVFRPLPAYRQAHLDNGLSVWMLQHGTVEVAEVQALFGSGKNVQTKPGLASNTMRILSEGTASFDSQQLAEKLDDYGAWISSDTAVASSSVSLTAMGEHLAATLPLLAEVILQPSFPEDEYARIKRQKIQQLKRNKS